MQFPFGKTVTIHRQSPGGVDEYGDPIEGAVATIVVVGCALAPRMSTEPTERGRQGVIVGLSLYAPAGTVILATDRIEVGGELFDIEGEPGEWVNPFTGWAPGVEVALRRAEG